MRRTDIDQRPHFAERVLNIADERKIKFRHGLKLCLKMDKQIGLMKQLGAVRRKMFRHHRGQYLSAAQPATETDQL